MRCERSEKHREPRRFRRSSENNIVHGHCPLPSRRPNEVPEQDLVVQVLQARRGTRKGPDQLGSGNDAIWPLSQTSINPMRRGLFRLVIQLFDMLVEHSSGLYWK